MKNKSILFLSLMALSFLMISMVYASVTVAKPSASASLTGTSILNATGVQLDNCTFYAKSSSTGNSSWTNLGTFTNISSADATFVNGTFDSAILEDSNDYIFNATCRNLTNSVHDGTRSGITIANTVPTAPTSLSPATDSSLTTASTQTFSTTVTDARTTGCTYKIAIGGLNSDIASYVTGTATYSGSTCSFTKSFTSSTNGRWYWSMTASDGTDTASSSGILTVAIPGMGGLVDGCNNINDPACNIANQPKVLSISSGDTGISPALMVLGIIGVIILVVYLITKKRR